MPPALEEWDGKLLVVDGAHRMSLALKRGINLNCMVISGYIAHMLPVLPLEGWHEVQEMTAVPRDKRNYNPDVPSRYKHYELYRGVFPGSQGPRQIAEA